ncbi:hypothetical protein PanWU01x14_269410, partial [Parasponia andersonii]
SGSPDTFFVGLKHLEKFETILIHSLAGTKLSTTVSNSTYKVSTVLLDFLVPVLQNWSQSRKQVFDRRWHLHHTNNVDNCFHCPQYSSKNFRVFFSQVLL